MNVVLLIFFTVETINLFYVGKKSKSIIIRAVLCFNGKFQTVSIESNMGSYYYCKHF